jgi:hypothetical protein
MAEYTYPDFKKALTPGAEVIFAVPEMDGDYAGGRVLSTTEIKTMFGLMLKVSIEILHNLDGKTAHKQTFVGVLQWSGKQWDGNLPVRLINEAEKEAFSKRGEKVRLAQQDGYSYQAYEGSITQLSWYGSRHYQGTGRVMIDAETGGRVAANEKQQYQYVWMFQQVPPQNRETQPIPNLKGLSIAVPADDPFSFGDNDVNELNAAKRYDNPKYDWMRWPFLWGFAFRTKRWGLLRADGLKPIKWRKDAFDKLVLEGDTKQTVRALVEYGDVGFEDLVEGKGGGMIFLLAGPPGTGKTLTAEATAELLERPLYSITVGELGTDPNSLENGLTEVLDVASKWNAVILLDEADIFLEKRTDGDVVHNGMVGIFLRLLEYHNGVLFLTTNRSHNFDPAIYSRIAVAIRYPGMTEHTRMRIWANLLNAAGIGTNETQLEYLAEHELNGRQIKNSIRVAQALAASKNEEVHLRHILQAIDLATSFTSQNDLEDAA